MVNTLLIFSTMESDAFDNLPLPSGSTRDGPHTPRTGVEVIDLIDSDSSQERIGGRTSNEDEKGQRQRKVPIFCIECGKRHSEQPAPGEWKCAACKRLTNSGVSPAVSVTAFDLSLIHI